MRFCYGTQEEGKTPYVIQKRIMVSGEDLTDAQPGFDQRTNEPIVTFRFNTRGARRFAEVDAARMSGGRSRSFSTIRLFRRR